ncbi:McrC family protein [Gillisia sp. M10.2A]|uniref:McrC family protein n=1 Tax=Gillisia lutea TaxID=2909668 RepID=A0ABS9EE36_9FLAO|nr:McrC family protein [Gillisia lutea]MCF4101038.1 McrC family protein [Gillisia lutea]
MKQANKSIKVFEHQFLKLGDNFKKHHLEAFSKLNALHNDCYFDLRYNGLKFKNYVGVIQVDGLTIEILPKVDSYNEEKDLWQSVLIDMLKATKKLKVQPVGSANVNRQNIHLLDLYFEWFLREVELLIKQGLIKQYYRETKNVKALKGKLEFSGHIQKNLIHKERFYTSYQIYEKDHLIHQILFYAMEIIENFSKGTYLYSKCKSIQLDFPDVSKCHIDSSTFSKIKYNRKNLPYKTALEIAKFIILNYAPNISSGEEKMLGLLFDMNSLWEEYVLIKLKLEANSRDDVNVFGQRTKGFWQGITIRPDVVIEMRNQTYIIDTKWKNIKYSKPSTQDLRQMYVYNDYWDSYKAVLLYPSEKECLKPSFYPFDKKEHECGIGKINVLKGDKLNQEIGKTILDWFIKEEDS